MVTTMSTQTLGQPAEPHANQTFPERAYEFVRRGILDHSFRPGQDLNDGEIATQLGISRTPVREALRRLEREGLVVHIPRRGWTVFTLQVEDIAQIFEIKQALEGMMARRAAERLRPKVGAALLSAVADMEAAAAAGDRQAWFAADVRLHDVLQRASGNDRAAEIVTTLNAQWHRLRVGLLAIEGRIDRSTPEHRDIVERVLAGDGAEAERLMQTHLGNLGKYLIDLLTNLVLPFAQAEPGHGARGAR